MNLLNDWDGQRNDEVSIGGEEKKKVIRQKTLSLESFLLQSESFRR